MIFDILEQKIIDAGLAEPGLTLFRSTMPYDVRSGVMLRVPLDGIPIDPYIPGHHKGEIQVITRHTDTVEGLALAKAVQKAITTRGREKHPASEERGPAVISLLIPKTLPVEFPRLEGDGLEWSQHFSAVFSFEEA